MALSSDCKVKLTRCNIHKQIQMHLYTDSLRCMCTPGRTDSHNKHRRSRGLTQSLSLSGLLSTSMAVAAFWGLLLSNSGNGSEEATLGLSLDDSWAYCWILVKLLFWSTMSWMGVQLYLCALCHLSYFSFFLFRTHVQNILSLTNFNWTRYDASWLVHF